MDKCMNEWMSKELDCMNGNTFLPTADHILKGNPFLFNDAVSTALIL
jgi:hypothetical protein